MWDVKGTLHKFSAAAATAVAAILLQGCFNTNEVTWTSIDGGPSKPKQTVGFGGRLTEVRIGNGGYLQPVSSGGGGFTVSNTVAEGFSNPNAGNTGNSAGFKMTGNIYVGN